MHPRRGSLQCTNMNPLLSPLPIFLAAFSSVSSFFFFFALEELCLSVVPRTFSPPRCSPPNRHPSPHLPFPLRLGPNHSFFGFLVLKQENGKRTCARARVYVCVCWFADPCPLPQGRTAQWKHGTRTKYSHMHGQALGNMDTDYQF
jgi:hypothetical protein